MMEPLEQSAALRLALDTILTWVSPDDVNEEIHKRHEFCQELRKQADELSDTIGQKRNAIRALQTEIEAMQQERRMILALKKDHELDSDKLLSYKYSLLREKRNYGV